MQRSDARKDLGSLATTRLIAAALIGGVTVFAVVAWVMVQADGPMSASPAGGADVMLYAWAAASLAAVAAAVVLWRLKVSPLLESPRSTEAAPGRDMELQTGLIMTWAILEGAALFGVVVYLLHGVLLPYAVGLLLVWLGIGLTFPRSGWFRE